MKCDELLKLLNEYVDGEIDPAFCKEFEQHLAGCDPCKIVVDTIRKTILIYKKRSDLRTPSRIPGTASQASSPALERNKRF